MPSTLPPGLSAGRPDRARLRALPPGSLVLAMPDPPEPGARRVAQALLEEAAALGGGQVARWPRAGLLLGASPHAATRAADALFRLLGRRPGQWTLPAQIAALEAWLDRLPPAPPHPASLAALEAHCAALPLAEVARLSLFAEGPAAVPVAQRLAPADLPLPDPDLRAHARDLLCRRLLAALADPMRHHHLPRLRPGLRLLLDLPPSGLPQGPLMAGAELRPAPIALLPLDSLTEPRFPTLARGLAAGGWRAGLVSPDAVAPAWLAGGPHPLAAPPPAAAPPCAVPQAEMPGFIALGPAIPDWCRAPGLLWELSG